MYFFYLKKKEWSRRGSKKGSKKGSKRGVQKGGSTFCLHPKRNTLLNDIRCTTAQIEIIRCAYFNFLIDQP